jgi:hypothetical protein
LTKNLPNDSEGTDDGGTLDPSVEQIFEIDWQALDEALSQQTPILRTEPIHDESVRYQLALWFTCIFAFTILAALVSAMFGFHWAETKDLPADSATSRERASRRGCRLLFR